MGGGREEKRRKGIGDEGMMRGVAGSVGSGGQEMWGLWGGDIVDAGERSKGPVKPTVS